MNQETSNEAVQTTRGFNVIFIHSSLDDAGLTPQQFRVLAHISRRAGDGMSWASNEAMAEICRIHKDTLVDALKELERRKIISRTLRPGTTTLWRIKSPASWDLNPVPKTGNPGRQQIAAISQLEGHQFQRGDLESESPASKGGESPASKGGESPASKGWKGNPLKVIKEKESHSGAHAPNVASPSRAFSDGWVLAYKLKHKTPYDYKAKDGIAVDRLLKKGFKADDLLATAIKAWNQTDPKAFWNCVNLSHDVAKFCGTINEIKRELATLSQPSANFVTKAGVDTRTGERMFMP